MKNMKLPDGWKVDKLENIVSFTRGSEPGSDSYTEDNSYTRFLRVSDISGTSKENIYTVADKLKLVQKGDLLITLDGSPGIVADNFEGAISSGIRKIEITNKGLLQDYLKFYLKSDIVQRIIYKYATGATILHASKSIQYIEVVLPPLETQKKIVAVLEKAEKALEKRKEAMNLIDELVKSKFIEMFGDPASNPKGWNKDTIGSVIKSLTAGWSANGEAREKREGEKAVLKVSAVTQGFFKADEYKVIDEGVEIKKYVFPEKGDLLFSRANTREMVGATCIIHKDHPDLLLPDKLWKILFGDRVNVFYMKYVLSDPSIRAEFSAKSTGTSGSMYNVSMDKFKNIEIPVPTIELQNQFADFIKQVDKLKFQMAKSLEELENSYHSLMQSVFKGELFN